MVIYYFSVWTIRFIWWHPSGHCTYNVRTVGTMYVHCTYSARWERRTRQKSTSVLLKHICDCYKTHIGRVLNYPKVRLAMKKFLHCRPDTVVPWTKKISVETRRSCVEWRSPITLTRRPRLEWINIVLQTRWSIIHSANHLTGWSTFSISNLQRKI